MRTSEQVREDNIRGSKICNRCKERKPLGVYSKDKYMPDDKMARCKMCMSVTKAEQKAARSPEVQSRLNRQYNLKKLYGMTLEQYDVLLGKQGGRCAICGSKDSKSSITKHLYVDHDHNTGKIKGLLCTNCNTAIGKLGDDPSVYESAMRYIKEEA